MAAITARFVHLQNDDVNKTVEVKPFILANQKCDSENCNGAPGEYFCGNVNCLEVGLTCCL